MNANFSGINVSSRMFEGDQNCVVGVSCVFQTKEGEKGINTIVMIQVCTQEGVVIALRNNICGHWVEKTSYLVPLDLNKSPGKTELLCGQVKIQVCSPGPENWVYDLELLIFFRDGSTISERFSKNNHNDPNNAVSLKWNVAEPE